MRTIMMRHWHRWHFMLRIIRHAAALAGVGLERQVLGAEVAAAARQQQAGAARVVRLQRRAPHMFCAGGVAVAAARAVFPPASPSSSGSTSRASRLPRARAARVAAVMVPNPDAGCGPSEPRHGTPRAAHATVVCSVTSFAIGTVSTIRKKSAKTSAVPSSSPRVRRRARARLQPPPPPRPPPRPPGGPRGGPRAARRRPTSRRSRLSPCARSFAPARRRTKRTARRRRLARHVVAERVDVRDAERVARAARAPARAAHARVAREHDAVRAAAAASVTKHGARMRSPPRAAARAPSGCASALAAPASASASRARACSKVAHVSVVAQPRGDGPRAAEERGAARPPDRCARRRHRGDGRPAASPRPRTTAVVERDRVRAAAAAVAPSQRAR